MTVGPSPSNIPPVREFRIWSDTAAGMERIGIVANDGRSIGRQVSARSGAYCDAFFVEHPEGPKVVKRLTREQDKVNPGLIENEVALHRVATAGAGEGSGIVACDGLGIDQNGTRYHVSPCQQGGNLREALSCLAYLGATGLGQARPVVSPMARRDYTRKLLREAIEAARTAAGNNVVHGDMYEANFVLGRDGRTCLIDFGGGARFAEDWESQKPFSSPENSRIAPENEAKWRPKDEPGGPHYDKFLLGAKLIPRILFGNLARQLREVGLRDGLYHPNYALPHLDDSRASAIDTGAPDAINRLRNALIRQVPGDRTDYDMALEGAFLSEPDAVGEEVMREFSRSLADYNSVAGPQVHRNMLLIRDLLSAVGNTNHNLESTIVLLNQSNLPDKFAKKNFHKKTHEFLIPKSLNSSLNRPDSKIRQFAKDVPLSNRLKRKYLRAIMAARGIRTINGYRTVRPLLEAVRAAARPFAAAA